MPADTGAGHALHHGPYGREYNDAQEAEMEEMEREPEPDERALIVAYLIDRADWLDREASNGGSHLLRHYATSLRSASDLIANGRHHAGGHR